MILIPSNIVEKRAVSRDVIPQFGVDTSGGGDWVCHIRGTKKIMMQGGIRIRIPLYCWDA